MAIQNPTRAEIGDILKRSKTIAVVGLSDNPDRTSYMVSKAMQDAGYRIIPVNPNAEYILGEKSYKVLTDIQEHVDIVNVFRRSEHLMGVAEEFVQIDADVYWAQLGLADEAAYEFLREKGYTVIMDRCIKVEHALTK
ncbi:CoA-binding protein [Ectobacillus ponti]|uniref:CoA-binding protein n=1 Tax=Ectobacillus ponti TaxID=2961894 RepID=A0AA41X573_9BACI|nr:CoA-binding protein [Ectobacillus ponti]MCP8969141.1 CoA-binding protein [Ectobacillus ponti]